ncbi:MAG: hypothetical protein HKP44_13775 [Desulfofustis sp.]|nr:hypothetical protein [Desulfofustis sp.]NNK58369.1 hypothetical protein [Desulfofustis sp.]
MMEILTEQQIIERLKNRHPFSASCEHKKVFMDEKVSTSLRTSMIRCVRK